MTSEHSRTFDILAFGEALIDLISKHTVSSLADADEFRRFIGGEVTNVTLNVARLGGRAVIVACVGDDGFGGYIRQQLDLTGVNTDYLGVTSQAPTTVAIIARQTATPDFIIYRGADAHILPERELLETIQASRVVHTSAFALSREPARSTILQSLEAAQQSGCLVSLDPNYHPYIWPDVANFQNVLAEAYQWVHITKPSLDDCTRLFGPGLSPVSYAERFLNWGPEIVALTMGAQGVLLATADGSLSHIKPGNATVADVTGAGDAFWAGLLIALLDGYPPHEAACFGQIVAEAKIGTVGPLQYMPNRDNLYQQLEMIKQESIAQPPQNWGQLSLFRRTATRD
ncbi:MAG: carbohydrate kinase family protein [Chloroflexota bacterium]|nr:carbohydrate kinase family protein [Chloroflexota bacterium]